MRHELKIAKEYFDAVDIGRKTFELRKNDRQFNLGDELLLREFSRGAFTGRELGCHITYTLTDCEQYGLQAGYIILGIRPFLAYHLYGKT